MNNLKSYKIQKEGIYILLSKVLSSLIIFINTVLILNYGGTELIGNYTLFFSTSIIFVSFIDLGVTNSSVFFIKSKQNDVDTIIFNSIILVFFSTLLLSIVASFFSGLLNIPYKLILSIGVSAFFHWLINYFSIKKQTDSDYFTYFIIKTTPNLIHLLLVVYFIVFSKLDFLLLVYIYITGLVFAVILIFFLIKINPKIDFEVIKLIFYKGLKAYKMNLIASIAKKGDIYLINIFGGSYFVGLYSIPLQCSSLMQELTRSMMWPLFNKINKLKNKLKYDIIVKFIENQMKLISFVLLISIFLIFFGLDFVIINDDIVIIKQLSVLIILVSYTTPFINSASSVSVSIGKLDLLFRITIFATIIQYTIILIFNKQLGIFIFPITFIINQIIIAIYSYYFIKSLSK